MSDEKKMMLLAAEAETILNTELFKVIMAEFTQGVCNRWRDGHFVSVDAREEAYHEVRAAEAFRTKLQSYLDEIKIQGARGRAARK